MKKTRYPWILMVAALWLLFGCHQDLDKRVLEIQEEVEALEERVSRINSDLSALSELVSALEKNDHISSVVPFQDGTQKAYRITFTSGTTLVLTSGTDGVTPIVGIRYNEQLDAYYWTIQMGPDGTPTWMTNSYGLFVKATGTVPRLKIEDGIWWYSFDGSSWNKTGWGPAQGKPGTSLFTSIDISDPYFVAFVVGEYNLFRLPTQRAFDEISDQCRQINEQFQTYTDLVGKIPGDVFVKSVAEFEEDGAKGCRITLESGKVLTIRSGYSNRDSVLISARAWTDGKYYWVYRSRSGQEYDWLRYKGEKVAVSFEDVTPRIGIADSLGVMYFTISYAGGESEWMKDADGKPVAATGNVVPDFFTKADLSDPSVLVLTMEDGREIRLPRVVERRIPSIGFICQIQQVSPSQHYTFQLLASVKDTLPAKEPLTSYDAYRKASGLNADAIVIDKGGFVDTVAYVSFQATKIKEGVEYSIFYDICFSTDAGTNWDLSQVFRIAFFLTSQDFSIMKVAEFGRALPTTELTLNPKTLKLSVGAKQTLKVSFKPANSTDTNQWDTTDPTVATVSPTGEVQAVGKGNCTITLTRGKLSQTCECTVI